MAKVGERVGAVSHTDGDTVYLFGYGVYEGDFVREGLGVFGEASEERRIAEHYFKEHNPEATAEETKAFCDSILKNPRIRLDNGKTVWGAQCWWGPEEAVKKRIGTRKVVIVDIDEQMAEARASRVGATTPDSERG